mgnify:CR=1 FL=1
MKNFDEKKYKRRLQKVLTSEVLTKALLRLPKKERSMFVMTFLRNDRLEYVCKVLSISKREAVELKKQTVNDFLENIVKLEVAYLFDNEGSEE